MKKSIIELKERRAELIAELLPLNDEILERERSHIQASRRIGKVFSNFETLDDWKAECCIIAVCETFGVNYEALLSKNQSKPIVEARHALCHTIKTHYDFELKKIGYIVSRDHSNVIYAIEAANRFAEQDPNYKEKLEAASKRQKELFLGIQQ